MPNMKVPYQKSVVREANKRARAAAGTITKVKKAAGTDSTLGMSPKQVQKIIKAQQRLWQETGELFNSKRGVIPEAKASARRSVKLR